MSWIKRKLYENVSRRKIVVYTDRSLQREDTQQKIEYSIVQIDEQNNIVCSHRGKLEKWFLSTWAELAACLIAVLIAPNESVVEIRTDSLYAIAAISESLKNKSIRC